ncbi:hypothetical protein IQ247_05870 [Plectonema cf. radiosum LEGE 06105]|uniref:Uncharacterized protein n=2 Tax=Plectonema TaxID=1183 RepID=A0A8J7EY56_9CYAN|nr:hypothetical protein [Plectonema cf. radiosum LEGE 06105]
MKKFGKFQGAIALSLMALVLPACANNEEANIPGTGNVTTEDVVDNTAALAGKTVTVRSEPVDKVGPASFTVSDQKFFGSEPILVINASGEPFTLPADDIEVQVTGIVRNLVVADIEREYDLDLDTEYYTDYENKPAIIAQSIALAPDPGDITKNPQKYYNQRLAVTGEVEDIQDANTFTLDEEKLFGATDLLVVNPNPKVAIQDDQVVAVTGVLRPFVLADFEREYDLGWDLQLKQSIEAEYSTKPVFVADSVYPSAISE